MKQNANGEEDDGIGSMDHLQFADIKVGDAVKVPDVAGGQIRPRHQRRRDKAVKGFDAVGGAELSGQLGDARVDVNHGERGGQCVDPCHFHSRQVRIAVQLMLCHR